MLLFNVLCFLLVDMFCVIFVILLTCCGLANILTRKKNTVKINAKMVDMNYLNQVFTGWGPQLIHKIL